MAAKSQQVSTPLLDNILQQGTALRAVALHHGGVGRNALMRAASLLAKNKRVVVSGMGASFFACLPFAYSLSSRGLSVITVEASELLYFLQHLMDAHTVVLLVSRSGESVEVLKLLPEARKRGASVLGLTNVPESTLDRESDAAIVMASPPDELVAIQTYVSTIATLGLLDAAISDELNSSIIDLEQTANVLSRWLPECVEARFAWTDFLHLGEPLYLLGRGPAMGSVAEGVLLMHEIAKSTAVGMSVAQFRHGPVEVVDSRFRAVIWGTQLATAALDGALASDLIQMGGQVRWIGPPQLEFEISPLCNWPMDVPKRFVSIIEVVPLQLAAYRKAELNGIRPGDFRWAPAITTSEKGFPASLAE